uniref:RNA-directed DNA methylation 4 n=1 Tax=Noccaea caerulescens TaxID=107243 RepID=A0A1J3F630_NOCCA
MATVGESSSTQKEGGEKPVIVRVKRKVGQSPFDAFWLEINERPFKRPYLDLSKLSIKEKEVVKPKKVFVQHLETVTDSETTIDIIHSFFESDLGEESSSKGKLEERKFAFKKENRKEQRLTKAVQQHQTAAKNARFEQIWRSRKGNKEGDKELHDKCKFYDIIRVDAEERPKSAPELTSLEDQKMLASFLPLLREFIPSAAEELEGDINSSHTEEYVYDYYAVNEEMDICEDSSQHQFPLVTVEEEEEFCDGSDVSDYDSDDSNAEAHPRTDYPEEISEEEDEEEEDDDGEEDEEEKSEASDESEDEEKSERHVRMVLGDEEDEFDGYAEDVNCCSGESDDEEFEYTKWSYR